ncbi:flagellar hook-associated protein 1 FlgK [Pseudaminobacter salicylatoxidans]|uniref:Flagellar hook-associated protein 1 n=1 Tax=Pseudaminobacter salicylatoxidans TaxID=93369 RepID=A0A316C6R5_PSESE|nr:flagellar hook-associated protein FlgK [Pseudaminobacter salicylatoxidans]PWJ83697.1 flagellar hook-associated protein 1 FlgK [Pseudaminobacter salicylatoxidans]
MSLSTALNIAQSSLLNTGIQTSVVSRNVMQEKNSDYSRRTAVLSSNAPGARVVVIHRATSEQLFRQNLSATSSWSAQSTLTGGLERLNLSVNGVDGAMNPAASIAELQKALQIYSASPSNRTLADNAVSAAQQVVRSLNEGAAAIQTFRVEADQEIAASITDLNALLAQFKDVNNEIVAGTRAGRDVNDALDQRDGLLKKISEYVPISTFNRGDNDMVIMTADGTTLFETVPRSVTFEPAPAYAPGATGNQIYIDGVPLQAGKGANTNSGGKLSSLVQLRDGVAVAMQQQLDEVARGLISAFAETDPSGALPDAAGLFTWPGAPTVPDGGLLVNGLAGQISVNAAFVANSHLLRDGGANGTDYVHNADGGASYADLLLAYNERMDQPMDFDPLAGNGDKASLTGYASNSVGWFQGLRQDASRASDTKEALAVRTAEALSNDIGINVDMEMSNLLDLEHSYQASARLIQAVDDMLSALLAAVR